MPRRSITPERLSDEHRLIARTSREFADKEVIPAIDRLEQKDWALARRLLQRAGELGLLGVDAPEEFGGVGLDKAAALVVSSHTAGSASFSAAFGAQGNLAINAILLLRHTRSETPISPRVDLRRAGWRVCAQRVGLGIRRPRRVRARPCGPMGGSH